MPTASRPHFCPRLPLRRIASASSLLFAIAAPAFAQGAESAAATSTSTAASASTDKPTHTQAIPAVTVTAHTPPGQSMRVERANLGPLGDLKRVDTPYSINVVPQHVIRAQQLKSIADALRFIPSVQGDGARPQSRGIQGSVVQNSRIDGLNAVSTTDYPLEQFDRIEVLNGLAGALYGPANPAGTFNYVQKRPTDSRLFRVTLGYAGGTRFQREIEASDRVGPSKAIGYRFTLLDETGSGYTEHSTVRRQLASLALDFHLSPNTVIETNVSRYHYVAKGFPATFALAGGVHLPGALDPTNAAYGSVNGGSDNTTTTGSIQIKHDFSPDWRLSAAVLRQIADRESTGITDTLIDNAGNYRTTLSTATASRFTITSNLVYLNGKVKTGSIEHRIGIGTSGFVWDNFNPVAGGTSTLGMGNLANPQSVFVTGAPDFEHRYQSAQATQQSLLLNDDIAFSPRWSVLLAGSQSWLSTHNYNVRGTQTSESANQGLSGSASLVFKPAVNQSLYLTYADSLQQGDTAPTGSANAGNILDPYRSKQWEVGYKVAFSRWNTSLAAFRITRPYAYTMADGIYRTGGEQRNLGVEWMLDGHLTRNLSLFGGVAWLDPRLFDTGDASTDGKQIVGLPKYTVNLLAEYDVRQVPGLAADVNLHYVGARATDNANSGSAAAYATVDLGVRYLTSVFERAVTLRLAVDNLTNRQYWTNIVPGGLNGYTGAGNATAQLGAPRTVMASVEFEL
ncbi:TonB-dependent receptor [Burkholderia sp. 3C]